jgi:hypothetical protein
MGTFPILGLLPTIPGSDPDKIDLLEGDLSGHGWSKPGSGSHRHRPGSYNISAFVETT